MGSNEGHPKPQFSRKIRETDDPVMVTVTNLLGDARDVLSLGQGAVYWGPPASAVQYTFPVCLAQEAAAHALEPEYFMYNSDFGILELQAALVDKIQKENGLTGYNVMVTAGANQAVVSLFLTLMDPGDKAVLFRPYYFNALMSAQMVGGAESVCLGPSDPATFHPDLDWLEAQCSSGAPPKVVYVVNPCNPTGVTLSREELQRMADITARSGTWLVVDDTYESFLFGEAKHHAINAPHIFHIFSFSKGYGLMGWRVGYIAVPDHKGDSAVLKQLVKVQDCVPIHAAIMSQKVALGTLRLGKEPMLERIQTLRENRRMLLEALEPVGTLGGGICGGDAIYMLVKLPAGFEDDVKVVTWMVHRHGVAAIPGTACGAPGSLRVAFGKPEPAAFKGVAMRMRRALQELVDEGPRALDNMERVQL